MAVALGIGTGGTCTNAVLVDQASGEVLAGSKALTTRDDLSVGVGQAVAAVIGAVSSLPSGKSVSRSDINLVGVSSTRLPQMRSWRDRATRFVCCLSGTIPR